MTVTFASSNPVTGVLTPILPPLSTGANSTPRGRVVDVSGMFVYSARSGANQATKAGIDTAGLTAITAAPIAGAEPIGVVAVGSH